MVEQFADHDKPLEQLVRQKMAELKTNDWDYAFEEVVADACERMLLDSKAMEKLAKLKQKDPNIFKEFIQHIKDLITKIRSLYKDIDATNDYSEALQAMDGVMDRFYELFEDMAVDAVQNFQKANGKSNSSSEQIKYSEKDFPIDRAVQDIVRNSLATKNESKMRTLGVISPEENKGINRLSNRTNNDHYRGKYTNGKHLVSDAAIRHMMAEHGDFLRESLRAQLPLKETDIARTLSAIKDNRVPKSLDHSRTKRGNPSIITSFEINGYTLYAEEITRSLGKNLPSDLIGHTMYKAPTLATAAFGATSATTQPKRQSEVLCNYYMPKSSNMSSDYFVSNKNGEPALLNFTVENGAAMSDSRNAGLIALSSAANNLSGNLSQGYVRCKKPFYITGNNRVFSNSDTNVSERIKALKDQGYDCFIFDYETGDNHFVAVVNKSQIIEPKNMKGVSSQQTLGANNLKKQGKKNKSEFSIYDDPLYPKTEREVSAFNRSIANKTSDLKNGEEEVIFISTENKVFIVHADGYMNGRIAKVVDIDGNEDLLKDLREEYKNGSYEKQKGTTKSTGTSGNEYRRYMRSISALRDGAEHTEDDSVDGGQHRSGRTRGKNGGSSNSGKVKSQKKKLSNRTLLANALQSAIDTSTQAGQNELSTLKRYQSEIAKIEALEQHLAEVNAEIKELSFGKGKRDSARLNALKEDKTKTANRINTHDRRLLGLEATKPLKDILAREKEIVRKRAEQKGKEALAALREKNAETVREIMARNQESRRKNIENRHSTQMRHKIKDIVADLNKVLLNPTKEKHIPIGLQKAVAEALDVINMDTINAEARVAEYNDQIAKSSNPDEIAKLVKSRDYIASCILKF